MQYQTFPPPPDLSDIVEHLWAVDNPMPLDAHREILIPNGRPTLLVCLADPGVRRTDTGFGMPNASNIAGPMTHPVVLEQSGLSRYAAAQLHPWGLAALGTGPLIDATADLGPLAGEAVLGATIAACASAPFGPDRALPVADLLRRLRTPLAPARREAIARAVEHVDAAHGAIGVEDLADATGRGYDALYRLFKAMTGLSPKQYIAIMRYFHFSGELLKDGYGSVALLANMQGYYDQAHATREFRRFTGISQTRFKKRLNGIARLMHGA